MMLDNLASSIKARVCGYGIHVNRCFLDSVKEFETFLPDTLLSFKSFESFS
jgi:hypothetical protein